MIPQITTQLDSSPSTPLQESGVEQVSLSRIAVSNLASFGLYQIYWLYKTAKNLHQQGRLKVLPELCLIGLLIPVVNPSFVFVLFKTIANAAQSKHIDSDLSPLAATTILTVANFMIALNFWQGATHNEPTHHVILLCASIIFYLLLSTGVLWSQQKTLNKFHAF
ncbi:MAG: hypothetical protein KIT34_03725 [Cyanobacteria bacterium TGS_CYA1]|nr:hypothetical protein [Cyanobacteria bacterium TGS_CYA1]